MDTCHPLSSLSHNPLPLDFLDQYFPNSNNDQEQGSHFSQVEEKEGEDSFEIYSIFQNIPCQHNVLPSLVDFKSKNLGDEANEINFHNQPKVLDNHHPNCYDSIIVCDDGFPRAPLNFPISQEYFDLKYLDIEYVSIKEYVIMETSSSPHYPLCSTFCNATTCEEDTPCYSSSSSNELDSKLTQGSKVIHDGEEGIKYPSHSLSFPILHEEKISIKVTHEICTIYPYLDDMQLEESFDLGNLFVEDVNFDQIRDVSGCHLDNSDLVETTDGSCP